MAQTDHSPRSFEIRLPSRFEPEAAELVSNVLGAIPQEDIAYKLDDGVLAVQLYALDLNELIRRVDAMRPDPACTGGSAREQAVEVLSQILECAQSIHSYGIKGRKRVYVGYAEERKVKNRQAKVRDRARFYYAVDSGFQDSNNELSDDLANQIVCGDSELALKKYPDNCIDLVFTSPPYNFGLEYENGDDASHWRLYFEKLFRVFDECIRVLKFGGRIVVNVQPLFSDYIPSHHIISNYLMTRRLIWKGEILWEKNNYNCKYTAWGSWKSPSSPYLKYTWEFLEVFAKGTLQKSGDPVNADITADEFKKWVVAKWSIAPEREMKRFGHPAMFPEELASRVIKLFSFQGDLVLDPFNGVGTTTLAAKKLGRRFVGVDLSPTYCETARQRLGAVLF